MPVAVPPGAAFRLTKPPFVATAVHRLYPARAAAALALTAASAVGAAPERFTLDPAHSFVYFEVMHFGTSTLRGRLGPVNGEVMLDAARGAGELGLAIPMAGVNTGVPVLDRRLCEPDLLDCSAWPTAWFVARQFRFDAQQRLSAVNGELTLRGVSEPLLLTAERTGCHNDPLNGRRVCGGDFVAELQRSRFGATFGLPFVGDRVRLLIQVEGASDGGMPAAPARP